MDNRVRLVSNVQMIQIIRYIIIAILRPFLEIALIVDSILYQLRLINNTKRDGDFLILATYVDCLCI